ncbi:MAG: hypothetical protein K6E64_03815 [Lachnospiraceae bacterium]|nr:hypothetical protein [Lachnospiraceae bacterium]
MARNFKYTEDQIVEFVKKYVKEHIDEKLKFDTLYEALGISRSAAYREPYYTILKNEIAKYNYAPARIAAKVKKMSALSEVIDKCNDNPNLLKKELISMGELLKQQENNHRDYVEEIEKRLEKLKAENESLSDDLRRKNDEFNILLDKYNYYVSGKESMANLKDNSKKTKRTTFEDQFRELFGDA